MEDKNGKATEVVDCCYDVPLLESLQFLLRTEAVREQVIPPVCYVTLLLVHFLLVPDHRL